MNEQPGQQLIEAFFKALALKKLDQCDEALRQLQELAVRHPAYRSWNTYLTGIMANELHRDWATGERLFTSLLKTDLETVLRGRILIALGRTYEYQGRWREAIDMYEQSLTIFDEPGQAIERVKVWKNIAIVLEKGFTQSELSGDVLYQAARYCELALDALERLDQRGDNELWLEGTTLNTLGLVYRDLGDWQPAARCYERRIALGHILNNRYGVGMANNNLGEVLQRQGPTHWPAALRAYQKALAIYRAFGDRYEQIDALSNTGFLHQEMGQTDIALDYYVQAITIIESLRANVSSEAARAGFFATVADTYANAALLCVDTGRIAQAFDYVERARSRAFLDMLVARSAELSQGVETATLTLVEVQAALPADALLLEYFTTGLVEVREGQAAPGVQRHRFPPARTLIFAVTCDAMEVYDTGLSPNDLRPSRLDSAVEQHFLDPAIRRTLYARLIAPAKALLRGRQRLYFIPHGPLHYIPFHALIAPDGAPLLRADGPQIVYGPSATLLFGSGRAAPGHATEPCLALGYNGAGPSRLRFAEEEVRGVARLFGGRALAGSAPKRDALFALAPDCRLLHLSCHGRFDAESPLASSLHLAPGEDLTAAEVLERLRLRCDLVVLSACESGLSRVRRGDELVGLVRAFIYAAAPALLCTLWRVDERSTRLLMDRFYRESQAGAGFAEALKRAQLYLMNLTRQEAFDALVRLLTEDLFGPHVPPPEDPPAQSPPALAQEYGHAYLKGLSREEASPESATGHPDDTIFADPYYWAPFVLIGDHGSD